MRRIFMAAIVAALAACAAPGDAPELPPLRLAPAALGRVLAVQQRLGFEALGQSRQMELALEVDAESVRLAAMDLGQVVARIEWDGHELRQDLAPGWPAAVRPERVLRDLQFVRWPAQALRDALPPGWTLEESPGMRTLRFGTRDMLVVRHPRAELAELHNLAEGYRLRIESSTETRP